MSLSIARTCTPKNWPAVVQPGSDRTQRPPIFLHPPTGQTFRKQDLEE
ncbi:MAG: hypothetical protein ACM37W_25420 [Actinomycetota bacterium]